MRKKITAKVPLPHRALSMSILIGMPISFISASSQAVEAPEIAKEELEVIVVTATRRNENLQEVPISISALSESKLERLGVRDVANLENSVPNLDFGNTHTNDNPAITIRGISASAGNIGFEAGVGVYIDGVYMGRNASLNQPLTDIDIVEVLRGPQGTLFGKNTTVGALNIKTRRPTEDFEADLQLEAGNYNLFRSRARVSGSLIEDKLLGKLSVFTDDRDGYEENLKAGASDALDENQEGLRGELLFTPGTDLDVSLRWDWSQSNRKIIAWSIDENDKHGLSFAGNAPHVIAQDDTNEKRVIKGASLTAEYQTESDHTLTAITGYRDFNIAITGDQDFQPAERLTIDKLEDFEQFSQEFRIASPVNEDFKYVFGLYYYQQEADSKVSNIANELFPLIGVDAGFVAGLNTPLGFAAWNDQDDLTNTNVAAVKTTSTAVFFDSSYAFNQELSLLFGLRYTVEDKELDYSQQGINVLIPSYASFSDEREDNDLSPSIGVSYQWAPNINLYSKVSRGFKSGGWNATTISSPQPFGPTPLPENVITESQLEAIKFDPEQLTNYEIGFKSQLFDNSLRLNTAVFYIDYEDIQLSVFKGLEGSVTTNAGAARSRGFEIELEAAPLSGLNLSAAIGYSDAIFTQFDPNDTIEGDELDGLRLSGPKFNSHLSATYTTEIPIGYISVGLDYTYKSKAYGRFSNPQGTEFGSTSLLNGRVTVASDDNWEFALWGQNLLDRDIVIAKQGDSNLALFNIDFVNYAPPRTYGVTFTYRYF